MSLLAKDVARTKETALPPPTLNLHLWGLNEIFKVSKDLVGGRSFIYYINVITSGLVNVA